MERLSGLDASSICVETPDGGALNLTVLTHHDRIDLGALECTELVPDIHPLADGFETAVQTLLERATAERSEEATE